MLVYAVVTSEERERWKTEGHPFDRADVEVMDFPPGIDIRERLLNSEKPRLLVIDDACFGGEAISFINEVREGGSWETVHAVILLSPHQQEARNETLLSFIRKPTEPEAFEQVIKAGNVMSARRYPRREVMTKCSLIAVGKRVECRMRDVSVCGCRIDYEGELAIGGMVQMSFSLKYSFKTMFIKATAKVVRGIAGGYGLAFISMEPQSRSVIAAYVKG